MPNVAFRMRDLQSGIKSLIGILTRRVVLGGPRSIALIISKECNSQCVMCWYHSPFLSVNGNLGEDKDNGHSKFMDFSLCEKIIRETHQIGTFRYVLGGHGEPLLHPQFDKILDLLIRLKRAPYVITNGFAIDEQYAKYLSTKRAHYRISVHAGDVETWLRIHSTSSASQFESLTRAIKLLAASNCSTLSFMNVIQKANFDRVSDMIEYAHKLGVKDVLFLPVRANGNLAQVVLNSSEESEFKRHLQKCLKLADSYGINTNIKDYLLNNRFIRNGVLNTSGIYQKIPCYIGWIYSEFDSDGTMRPCENSDIIIGMAGSQSIKDMWLSSKYNEYRYKSLRLPLRDTFVEGCNCHECSMAKFNINVHNILSFKSIKYGEA